MRHKLVLALLVCALSASAQTPPLREKLLQVLDRPRVPLAPEVLPWVHDTGDLEKTRFTYASEAGQRVSGILLRSAAPTERRPVVIAMHATGDGKESMLPLLRELAAKGALAVAIDARYHGERAPGADGEDLYIDALLNAWRTGKEHPLFYDTAWDIMRLVDYLEARPDVDPAHIGIIGFSKGGMEAFYAAAADPRIGVVVPLLAVRSIAWELEHETWQALAQSIRGAVRGAADDAGVTRFTPELLRRFFDRVAPGIYAEFDGPGLIPLIAPRPLLLINGDLDALTPVPGFMLAVNAAKRAYATEGAADRFRYEIEDDTGHRVTQQSLTEAVFWLVRWLIP